MIHYNIYGKQFSLSNKEGEAFNKLSDIEKKEFVNSISETQNLSFSDCMMITAFVAVQVFVFSYIIFH